MEIYSGQDVQVPEPKASGALMLGFQVASLDDILEKLQEIGIEPKAAPRKAEWGKWVNVTDPDGRVVQLNEIPK